MLVQQVYGELLDYGHHFRSKIRVSAKETYVSDEQATSADEFNLVVLVVFWINDLFIW